MAFSALRTPLTSGLVALLLGTSACTSVTRRDVWKPEKEFSQTLPAGQREVTEYVTEILPQHQADSLDLRVVESAVRKTFNVYTLQSNRRERQYVEEETKTPKNIIYGLGVAALLGPTSMGLGIYLNEKEKEEFEKQKARNIASEPSSAQFYEGRDGVSDGEAALFATLIIGGLITSAVGLIGFPLASAGPSNYRTSTHQQTTDILRVSPAGSKEVTEQQGEPQVLYQQKPLPQIEVIATSDFFTLNGAQQRASFLTDPQGNAKLTVQLPIGYSLREKELYNALMPGVEKGSMQLDDVKRYVQQHAEQRTLTIKTALPERAGVNIRKNAEQTVTYTVYELPK